ncbi:MAG: MazG family protein, partial [Kordiimonadaceae bacterium]|nr:MazG family protein [Kordiimonadaceae bacterium]
HPDTGCPWDIQQTFATISPYTIEEAYEVDDAIRSGDYGNLQDELGDLLFQVVFHSQIAQDQDLFSFSDVVQSISDKMVRRHPHVFADKNIENAEAQTLAWEEQKAKERAEKAENTTVSALDGVAVGLPALLRAVNCKSALHAWALTGQRHLRCWIKYRKKVPNFCMKWKTAWTKQEPKRNLAICFLLWQTLPVILKSTQKKVCG